jgi:hypothetical protein
MLNVKCLVKCLQTRLLQCTMFTPHRVMCLMILFIAGNGAFPTITINIAQGIDKMVDMIYKG